MSLWKKIKGILSADDSQSREDDSELEFVTFQKKDPIDVTFAKAFTSGNGKFFYCDDEQEVLRTLQDIIDNEQIDEVICMEKELQSMLNRLNVKQNQNLASKSDYIFLSSEFLVAFDGSIILTSKQTKGRKPNDLPDNVLVYAKTNQFVENVSDAMRKLNAKKGNSLPTNITSIRGGNFHDMNVSSNAKNIYLLLEEQKH